MARVFQYQRGMANGYIVFDKKIIAVDTGCMEGEDVFLGVCEEAGVKPQDISLIAITHGHSDHFFNATAMSKLSGAPVMCHKNAAPFMLNGIGPIAQGRTKAGRDLMAKQEVEGGPIDYFPTVDVDIVLEDDCDLSPWGIDGKFICTPGHTDSCMSVVLDDGQVMVGDMIATEPESGVSGLAFITDRDNTNEILYDSVRRVLEKGKIFYSGHGGPFTREEVERFLDEDIKAYHDGTL